MDQKLEELYADNAKKLYLMVDRILASISGNYYKDKDEFRAEASNVIADIVAHHRYDKKRGNFEGYLYGALRNAFIDIIKKQNAYKRKADKLPVSLDAPINYGTNTTLADFLYSDFDIDSELEEIRGEWSENIEAYLNSLTKIQRKILNMKMNGMTVSEIKNRLHLSQKQYDKNVQELKRFEHISMLQDYITTPNKIREDGSNMAISTQTLEKSKPNKMSISSIVKKMDKGTIRFDHPLQRSSDQWNSTMKGNLISDILQGNPLPELIFAEQVVNGVAHIWDLDGKQRCTNTYAFAKNQYKISKNIRRYMIVYQVPVKDEENNVIMDENNFPLYERKEFDIRGKKFSDLPEELQERFQDYNFEITQYLNCTPDDIAYHIARYNEGKPATVSQKGIIRLGEEFAIAVKGISNMTFFKDMGGYKVSEFKNGTINRVVVESVMASYYISDWKKKQEDMCDYIRKYASISDFEQFENNINRLEKVITDDVSDMFDSKDSFLWFGLFSRFIQICNRDELFIEFMRSFANNLYTKEIDHISFDELNKKSTKDKLVIQKKMKHLEMLLEEYLSNTQQKKDVIEVNDEQWKKYMRKFVDADLTCSLDISDEDKKILALQTAMFIHGDEILDIDAINKYIVNHSMTDEEIENILLYMDMLNSWSLELQNGSVLTPSSIPCFIRITQYAFTEDVDDTSIIGALHKWSKHFTESFSINQMNELYLHIKDDLDHTKHH